jgi:hypothetical protein
MTITRNHNVRAAAIAFLKLAYVDKVEITPETMQKYKASRRALKKGCFSMSCRVAFDLAMKKYNSDLFLQNKKNREESFGREVRKHMDRIEEEFFEKAKLLLSKLQETRHIWGALKTGHDIQKFLFEEERFATELWILITNVSIVTHRFEKYKDGLWFVVEDFVGYSCQIGGSLVLFPNDDYPSGLALTYPEGKHSYIWTNFENYHIKPIPPTGEIVEG